LAKTDQVDARTLRDFADVLAGHKDRAKYITAMLDAQRQALAELMTRRGQLVDMRVAENNHLEHAGKRSSRSIISVLKTLDKQVAAIGRSGDHRATPASASANGIALDHRVAVSEKAVV
jgi:transposase